MRLETGLETELETELETSWKLQQYLTPLSSQFPGQGGIPRKGTGPATGQPGHGRRLVRTWPLFWYLLRTWSVLGPHLVRPRDGWTVGRMGGRMGGRMDGRIDGRNRPIDRRTDGQTD